MTDDDIRMTIEELVFDGSVGLCTRYLRTAKRTVQRINDMIEDDKFYDFKVRLTVNKEDRFPYGVEVVR